MKNHDADIRPLLFDWLDERYGKVRTLEEKNIAGSRSDILAATADAIIGFEIKSDADTYARLATQVKDYDLFFDLNYVVCGQSHLKHIGEHIPEYWGIIAVVCGEEPTVTEVRTALANPKMKALKQMRLMWRRELDGLLAANEMPKYKGKSRDFVSRKLLEKVEPLKLKAQMCDMLFERDYTVFENEKKKPKRALRRRKRRTKPK